MEFCTLEVEMRAAHCVISKDQDLKIRVHKLHVGLFCPPVVGRVWSGLSPGSALWHPLCGCGEKAPPCGWPEEEPRAQAKGL